MSDAVDPLAGPLVPGHPLYADMAARDTLAAFFEKAGFKGERAQTAAAGVLHALASHDPRLLICTAHELDQRDEEIETLRRRVAALRSESEPDA
jgi:hypothetical protein